MKWIVLTVLALSLTGCLQTRTAVREQEEKQVLQKTVKTLQQSTADVNTRFSDIEDDLRKLNGRVEASEHKLTQMQANDAKGQQGTDQRVKELSEKLQIYQDAITKLDSQVSELTNAMAALQDEMRRSPPASASGGGGKSGSAPSAFAEAEEFFKKNQWKEAILEYEKFRKNSPRAKQFAEATYKIGVCFQELGLTEEAKAFYEEVSAKYPKSKESEKANYRLRNMKKK